MIDGVIEMICCNRLLWQHEIIQVLTPEDFALIELPERSWE